MLPRSSSIKMSVYLLYQGGRGGRVEVASLRHSAYARQPESLAFARSVTSDGKGVDLHPAKAPGQICTYCSKRLGD